MSSKTTSPVLKAITADTILQSNTASPLTKTQKRKEKKQQKEELKQRARLIAEKQKQGRSGIAATSKSSETISSSEKTASVITANEPEVAVNAPNNKSSLSDHGSSDISSFGSSIGLGLALIDANLPLRAKKIREHQRQQNRQKNLLDLGGGIVETKKPSSFRKQPPSKNRRPLTKHDKVKHNLANPAANLILKHQNDSVALNEAAQRIASQQEARKAQNALAKGNTLSTPFSPSPVQLEQQLLAEREKLAWARLFASWEQRNQQEGPDDTSDRCVTIASDSDNEDVPKPATQVEDGNAPESVARSISPEIKDVVMHSDLSVTDDNLDKGDSLSALSDIEHQIDEAATSEEWITSDDTGTPGDSKTSAGSVGPDEATASHDAGKPDDIASPDANIVSTELSTHEDTTLFSCTIEVVSTGTEHASHIVPDDFPATPIESGPDLPTSELHQAESASSWVSRMLSLPNAAQYPPALSLDQELALIALHVTPLSLPETKEASKAEESITKSPSEPSASSEAIVQPPSIEPTATEPTEIETPTNENSTQVEDCVVTDLSDQSLPAEEKSAVEVAAEMCGFVASMLSRPNGSGQTAAERELHETLVRLHVAPLEFPVAKTKESKKASKNSTEPIASLEDEADVTLPSPTEMATIKDEPSTSHKTVEDIFTLEEAVTLGIPLTPLLTPLLDDDPVSEVKIFEEVSILTSSSSTPKLSDISRRSSPTSKPSNSSKTSSRRSSVRSDEPPSNDLERKIYQARNTYLGVASLEDFLILLDFDGDTGSTTKTAICETFTTLSADEAEVILGHRPAELNTDLPTAYAERRIKLGSTTLSAFLQDTIFGHDDMTHVAEVIRSFKTAAQHDVQPSAKLAAAFSLVSSSSVESSSVSSPMLSFRLGSGIPSPQAFPSRSGLCLS